MFKKIIFDVISIAAMGLCAATLSGCEEWAGTPINIEHNYPKDSKISAFCKSLGKGIEDAFKDADKYEQSDDGNELIKGGSFLDLEDIMSGLDLNFRYLDWKIIADSERFDAFLVTLPLHTKSYDATGKILSVSITTINEYAAQFEEKTKGLTYARSEIGDSGYSFLRRIPRRKVSQAIDQNISVRAYYHYVYPEFEGLPFGTSVAANTIVVFNEYILFLETKIYPENNADELLGIVTVRIFEQGLKPGEKPFHYNIPSGPRTSTGPLRHWQDGGCRFTLFHQKK